MEPMDCIHSSLVPTRASVNKKLCVIHLINFIYPCPFIAKFTVFKRQIIRWAQLSSATCFETTRMSFKNVLYLRTTACCINAYWLTPQPITWRGLWYTCASSDTVFIFYHVARNSTYVSRVQTAVHFVHHMFTLDNQRTKRASCNWLRCLLLFMKAVVGTKDECM